MHLCSHNKYLFPKQVFCFRQTTGIPSAYKMHAIGSKFYYNTSLVTAEYGFSKIYGVNNSTKMVNGTILEVISNFLVKSQITSLQFDCYMGRLKRIKLH